jgi:hypothetical protein
MATQQQAGTRAYNIFDLPQIRRAAFRTPNVPERDLEGDNRLRQSIIEQIGELEKVDADIKKGVIDSYTEQQKAVLSSYTSALDGLYKAMSAQATTKGALANALDTLNKSKNTAEGILATGAPAPEYTTELGKAMMAPQQDFINKMQNRGELGSTAEFFAELIPAAGSPALYDQTALDNIVTALDQQFVSGPTGLVAAAQNAFATSGASPQFLAPNAVAAMNAAQGTIAAAVGQLTDIPEAARQKIYEELSLRATQGIKNFVDSKDPTAFQSFTATQSEAAQSLATQRSDLVRQMGVGVDRKERERIMGVLDGFQQAVSGMDPTAALAVAERKLADQGIMPPPPDAPADQQEAYKKQLTQVAADVKPMESYAQRMSNIPGSTEIREQIKYLKGLLPGIGKVEPDALTAATANLKASMGDAQFEAWRQMVGAATDEDAAVLAAKDPTKLAVFRRAAEADTKVLSNPRQYAAQIGKQAATEKATARQEARAAAPETVAATAPQPEKAPEQPTATKELETTQQPSAAVAQRKAAFEEEPGQVAQYTPPEEAAPPTPMQTRAKMQEQVAAAAPTFEQQRLSITSPRTQLFGTGGLMAQRARGA